MVEAGEMVVEAVAEGSAPADPEVVVLAMRPRGGADVGVQVEDADVAAVAGWGVDLRRRLARSRAKGGRGDLVWIDLEREQPAAVLMVGLGGSTPEELRRSAAAASRRLQGCGEVLVRASRDLDPGQLRAFVEGLHLPTGTVTWGSRPPPAPPARVRVVVGDTVRGPAAVEAGTSHARATLLARRLIHTPPNIKSPEWMADQAREVARATGLDVRVWDPAELARDGFGGILAVGAGSSRSPRLVQLTLRGPGGAPQQAGTPGVRPRHVVLVGKGITFDSGGLSLKPRDAQILMKTDMSGAAVVLAVMGALGLAGELARMAGLRVTGLMCLAENLPGASATRPGDVITHHGGLTSEVLNTDAEGRLVLGDALDYAVRDLGADVVVDVATLTGAATLGLGRQHAALFSNDDGLAESLAEAGAEAGERMWRMPLHAEYARYIESDVADLANVGRGADPMPGAITAALFLQRFVGDAPWAHIDIAGPGRSESERDEGPKGGTGFAARALLRWIEAGAPT